MKDRRNAGATHSFRLTMAAAEIVDQINHPRRLGGKSRKVSEAIEWYFSRQGEHESIEDLKASRKWWMDQYESLKKSRNDPPSRAWWRRFF